MTRPLIAYSTAELEEFFEQRKGERDQLTMLSEELQCRSRKPAALLLQRVQDALTALAVGPVLSEPSASDARRDIPSGSSSTHRTTTLMPPTAGWDESQRAVIQSPPDARLIVDAGPGTGKTAVACARVAFLIRSGVEPSNIWLISFTRTAIHELRNRIRDLVEREELATAVRITTLDSHALLLVQGFESNGRNPFGSYEQTIRGAIELLEDPTEEVCEYLDSLEHLIVDEAQDLVGIRAELVETLIRHVNPSCGVTVLCDEAQAIYGFSENEPDEEPSAPLPGRLAAGSCGTFGRHSLTTVHRTESPTLNAIFTGTRERVLARRPAGVQKLRRVREEILGYSDGHVGRVNEQELDGRDDTLVLFRQRVEVLLASSYLWNGGVAHRLRMSGLPTCMPAWIGLTVWDHDERSLSRQDFLDRLEERREIMGSTCPDAESAWRRLVAIAGTNTTRIDTRLLRARLSRGKPPVDLVTPEIGPCGPIIGTIHASKGREAGTVHLMLPDVPEEMEGDVDEETRVLFVGATRARFTLRTGEGIGISSGKARGSSRCYRSLPPRGAPRAQMEIGRDADLDVQRQVATSLFESAEDAIASQKILQTLIAEPRSLIACSVADDQFRYHLRAGNTLDAPLIGAFRGTLNDDLWEISRSCGARGRRVRLPAVIRHLQCVGVRTIAVADDDPLLPTLHPPFSESGFYLAPIIIGFTTVEFHDAKRK